MSNTKLRFTGERVVPDDMYRHDPTLLEHLARYTFAQPLCDGKIVLDAACGSGYGTKMLNATGVDVSAEAVQYAIDTYNISAVVHDLENGLPVGKWDVITSFETIEHLQDPTNFLRDVSEKCGHFIFSIPLNNPSPFHKQVYTLEQAKALIHLFFWNVRWFEQTGTEIHELYSTSPTFLIGVASN